MGSPETIDLEALLAPISPEHPAGEDLREDLSPTPIYYAVKDVRTEARAAERQGQFEAVIGAVEAATWRPVIQTACTALSTRSKDLDIVAWLTEALLRTDGFAGLRDAFRLTRELVERYWDDLFPLPDEDGLETKVAPLTGLNGAGAEGTLFAPISRIPITDGATPLATWSCHQARELERATKEAREERLAAGAVSLEEVSAAVSETPVSFFVETLADIREALAEWSALGAALSERCGRDAPPSSAVREALESCQDTVLFIAREVLPVETNAPVEAAEAAATGGAVGAAPAAPAAAPGELRTRDEAFRLLTKVADYFRRTEPHSPVSFMLQRTVRWGNMPLPQLLGELIPDASARETFQNLTGVEFSPEQE